MTDPSLKDMLGAASAARRSAASRKECRCRAQYMNLSIRNAYAVMERAPIGSDERYRCAQAMQALACRRDAWICLADGDIEDAAENLRIAEMLERKAEAQADDAPPPVAANDDLADDHRGLITGLRNTAAITAPFWLLIAWVLL